VDKLPVLPFSKTIPLATIMPLTIAVLPEIWQRFVLTKDNGSHFEVNFNPGESDGGSGAL
jgi:hypothetical protein